MNIAHVIMNDFITKKLRYFFMRLKNCNFDQCFILYKITKSEEKFPSCIDLALTNQETL